MILIETIFLYMCLSVVLYAQQSGTYYCFFNESIKAKGYCGISGYALQFQNPFDRITMEIGTYIFPWSRLLNTEIAE